MKILQYKKAKSSGQRGRPAQDRGMQATGSEQRDTGRLRTEGTGHWLRTEGCRPPAQDRSPETIFMADSSPLCEGPPALFSLFSFSWISLFILCVTVEDCILVVCGGHWTNPWEGVLPSCLCVGLDVELRTLDLAAEVLTL